MRRCLALFTITACIPTQVEPAQPRAPGNDIPFITNPERGDRVSPGDAPVADGAPDAEFTITVQGKVANIILSVCTEGTATTSHWDTLAGEAPLPSGFAWRAGKETWVLGVSDGSGQLINAADGSLPPLDFATATPLTLSAADNGVLASGTIVCVWVLRPDGSSLRASTLLP